MGEPYPTAATITDGDDVWHVTFTPEAIDAMREQLRVDPADRDIARGILAKADPPRPDSLLARLLAEVEAES